MSSTSHRRAGWKGVFTSHEFILFVVLVAEWVFFYYAAPRTERNGSMYGFATAGAQFDILRHSCEIGLLAMVMTPIILTGGIDLSVGSLMALSAVIFGKLWRDAHFPIWVAMVSSLGVGAVAGGLNAFLITWLRLPPLIVTLGTYSLFRGLAEALTEGADAFTNFPDSFTFWGNGFWLGLPAQLPVYLLVIAAVWIWVHNTTFGRSFRAIGFSPEGARYAGLPVQRRLAMVYTLTGVVAALAGLIFTSRLGTARADIGLGYELFAITAVVLGGTSIFGGTGSVLGTLLGVAAVAVLKNGLGLAHWPQELGGVLTGVLLILALTASVLPKILANRRPPRKTTSSTPQPTSH